MGAIDIINQAAGDLAHSDDARRADEILGSVQTLYDMIDHYRSVPRMPKIETGIYQIDEHLNGGVEVGQLIGVGGAPEGGKSTLLENIIDNISNGFKSYYFTLEFSPRDYADRNDARKAPRHKNIYVDPETYFIDEVEERVNLLSRYKGFKFFVIDSQMKLGHKELTGHDATNDIFRRLKNLARINEVVMFIIVQTSKADHESGAKGVYGSILAEHELNQFWFVSSDKESRTTSLEFRKNKQSGKYGTITFPWSRAEPTYHSEKIEMAVL